MRELKDTIGLMTSADYKDRLIAEYWQTRVRVRKLVEFIGEYRRGELDFTPSCPLELLEEQAGIMYKYMELLVKSATIEGVNLNRLNGDVDIDKALEWLADYAFSDSKEVYTNGTVLVPMFRVKQAFVDRAYLGFCESN